MTMQPSFSTAGHSSASAPPPPALNDDDLNAIITRAPDQPAPPVRVFRLPNAGTTIVNPCNGRAYTIGRPLGDGSFGVVFSATDEWDNDLAVKVLKPRGTYEQIRQAAQDEVSKLLSLRHTHITYVFDAFEYQDAFYIVSEQCGLPVSSFLDPTFNDCRGTLIRPIARCLLHALAYMHDSGYVHQDVHLNNVLVAWAKSEIAPHLPANAFFKLGDLGLAKPIAEINPANTLLAEWMLPPEYLDGGQFGPMDHRMDIYHSALLLLQVLRGEALNLTREDILSGVPRMMAGGISHPLGAALAVGLRRHVKDRPVSALAFWELIKNATAI